MDKRKRLKRVALYRRINKSIEQYGSVVSFREAIMPHGVRNYKYYSKNHINVSKDYLDLIHAEEMKWLALANCIQQDNLSPRQGANKIIDWVKTRPEYRHYLAYFLEYGMEVDNYRLLSDHFGYQLIEY